MTDPVGDENPELQHNLGQYSDEELEVLIRNGAETLYHPCCTARMAPLEDGGVVDTALRVWGVPNLRVVDASVFPTIVSGHTVSQLATPPAMIRSPRGIADRSSPGHCGEGCRHLEGRALSLDWRRSVRLTTATLAAIAKATCVDT